MFHLIVVPILKINLIENETNIVTQNISERVTITSHPLVINYSLELQWRHNGYDSVSNHQPYDCLFKRLFRRSSKKTSKLRVTGWPVKSPHKWPVTRKKVPFDDVIMESAHIDDSKHWIVRCLSILRYPVFTVATDMHGVNPVNCKHYRYTWLVYKV